MYFTKNNWYFWGVSSDYSLETGMKSSTFSFLKGMNCDSLLHYLLDIKDGHFDELYVVSKNSNGDIETLRLV